MDSREGGAEEALVPGENVGDVVTGPRVGQLTRMSVPEIFCFA